MSKFDDLQSKHLDLLSRLQEDSPDEFVHVVNQYIEEVKQAGSEVSYTKDREQLRANLRYWASFIYDKTGDYPDTTLKDPAEAITNTIMIGRWAVSMRVITIGIFILLGLTAAFSLGRNVLGSDFATPTRPPEMTDGPAVETATSGPPTTGPVSTPTATQTEPPIDDTEVPASTPTETPRPDAGIFLSIYNVSNGSNVEPRMVLEGDYNGLSTGSSIHVLLQPINRCGVNNILEENAFLVENNSGTWQVPVSFGRDEDLTEPEQYNVRIFIAQNAAVRQLLENQRVNFQDCFDTAELPLGLFPYQPLLINVNRGRFVHIQEDRVVFATTVEQNAKYDVATVRLDGSDFRMVAETPDLDERDPHLCSGNQKIVFVNYVGTLGRSIYVMDNNGENLELIHQAPDKIFKRPLWSPDCRFIAFGVRGTASNEVWEIHVIDYQNFDGRTIGLDVGQHHSWTPQGLSIIYNRINLNPELPSFIRIDLDNCLDFVQLNHDCPRMSDFYVRGRPVQGLIPSLSADETRILYTSFPIEIQGGYAQIIQLLNSDAGGQVVDLTKPDGLTQDWFAVWGPAADPQLIFFESSRGLHQNIWSLVDGSTLLTPIGPRERVNITPTIGFLDAFIPIQ